MKPKELFMYAVGGTIVLGFLILVFLMLFQSIPIQNNELLHLSVGGLLGSFTTVVGFLFGSSVGSKSKTEIMANGNHP